MAIVIDELTTLIEGGQQLLEDSNFNASRMNVWGTQVKRNLEQIYDNEVAQDFSRTLNGSAVIRMGASDSQLFYDTYQPKIKRAIEYLESLQAINLPKLASKREPASASSHHISVSHGGNVVVGDNSTINVNTITVGDMLAKLENEITQRVPDSEIKRGVLTTLKSLTTNETFAHVVGQTLGAFLGTMVK